MLIRPAETGELATPAVLKVTGKCGKKQTLSIEGVSIEFICEPQTIQPPDPTPPLDPTPPQETIPPQDKIHPPEVIPSPHPQDPGRIALVVEDFGTLLRQLPGKSEIDLYADPIVVTVSHDRGVSLNDLSYHISAAHQEHRAIRFDIGSQRQ